MVVPGCESRNFRRRELSGLLRTECTVLRAILLKQSFFLTLMNPGDDNRHVLRSDHFFAIWFICF